MPPRYKASDETPEENFDYECLECEESFREEETSSISLSTGECLCVDCYESSDDYIECSDCATVEDSDAMYYGPDQQYYCESCRDNSFSWCEHCEEPTWHDEMRCIESSDEYVCDSCYSESDGDPASHYADRCTNIRVSHSNSETFNTLNISRLVGIESEVVLDRTDKDENGDSFARGDIPHGWSSTYDGSIHGDGIELISKPANGDLLKERIDSLSTWSRSYNVDVNRSCGLHIHIDATDTTWEDLKWISIVNKKIESYIFSMMPESRRNSNWCKPMEMSLDDLTECNSSEHFVEMYYDGYGVSSEKYNDSRYHGLNLHARFYLGTIEFRYHSGTTNSIKITNWIKLCNSIVETGLMLSREGNKKDRAFFLEKEAVFNGLFDIAAIADLDTIFENMIKVDNLMVDYVKSRIQKFNNKK
tara:strand:- start:1057 stop:2313 length:1257 start_codon:yes stop_codon:yes gene_type:complete